VANGAATVLALPEPGFKEVEASKPPRPSHHDATERVIGRERLVLTHHARTRAHERGIRLPLLLAAISTGIFAGWRWFARDERDEDDLNRKAGELYSKLAEREFGSVRIELALVPDRELTKLVVPIRGEDIDREIGDALDRVFAIHDEVEQIAPELVGRIVFDYSADGRHP
jgi:hypothetical protein